MVGIDGIIDRTLLNHPLPNSIFKLGLILNCLGKGDVLTFLCILLLMIGALFTYRNLVRTALTGVLTLILVGPVVQILKHVIGRSRPKMNFGEFHFIGPNFFDGGFDSFPSGHSMASFAVASVLSKSFPRGRFFFYGMSTAIALLGRVSLRNHFLTDVIVGGILGYLIGKYVPIIVHRVLFNRHPRESQTPPQAESEHDIPIRRSTFLLLLFSTLILFNGLSNSSLWDRDETEYAQATLEMNQKGEWLIPTLEGEPFLEKPILLYWFTKISVLLFGANEFAFRFPSALFGVLTCLVTYGIGKVLFNSSIGFFSGLIVATSFLFIGCYRLLLTDVYLVFFTHLALLFYLFSKEKPRKQFIFLALAYLSLGIAVLAKGPIALYPIPIFIFYEWYQGENKLGTHLLFSLLILLVTGPWFLYAWNFQKGAASNFFWHENIARFLKGSEGHTHFILYHVPVLLLGFLPWSGFLITAFYREWKERIARGQKMDPKIFLLLSWAALLFIFFSISAHKLPHYLLPTLPVLACFLANYWQKSKQLLLKIAGGTAIFAILLSLIGLPIVEKYKVMKPIGLAIKEFVPKEARLIGYHISEPSLFIYGERLFPKIENESLDSLLGNKEPTYIVLPENLFKPEEVQTPFKVLAKKEGYAENSGKITLLLITNQ